MMRFVASALPFATLTAYWNLGYEGYFVPIHFSEAVLAQHVRAGSIDLDRSVVLVEGDELIGFSLLGVRGERGWIGGFGVAPAYRGRGLAQTLIEEQLAIARTAGLTRVQLEVMRQNWAKKVYARAGFATTRDLLMLTATLPAGGPATALSSRDAFATDHARLHASAPACWQREVVSLDADPSGEVIAVDDAILLTGSVGGALRIRDAAALGDADALLAALASRHPGEAVTIVNEPDGSPIHRALTALGAVEKLGQHEMHVVL
jgi:GNAT superfamily N-acetyltransferase